MSKAKLDLQTRAAAIVTSSTLPCEIQYVAKQLGTSWPTARSVLLRLVIENKVIELQTTSGRLLFLPSK